MASSANSWCDFRLLERQQTYDYCLWTSTLKYVIIMKASANHNSFWTYSLGVLLGMKIKPFTQLKRFFITRASTAHENSDCSDLFGNFSCDQTMQKAGQILETSTEVLTRAGPLLKWTSLYMWRKKLQPATLFVVLNIPPVCYEFPNLAVRAILEWTPGRAWRQSEDRELHLKKTSNPSETRKNIDRIFFYNDLLRPRIFWHETLWRTNFTNTVGLLPVRKQFQILPESS